MKRFLILGTALAMLSAPAAAQGLEGLLKQVETKAKSSVFDAAVQSQLPAAGVITQHLSDEQKARLLDLGVQNAGTLGKLGAATGGNAGTIGAAATGVAVLGNILGGARAQPRPPVQAAPSWGAPVPAAPAYPPVQRQAAPVYAPAAPRYAPGPVQARPAPPQYAPAAAPPRPAAPQYVHIGTLN